jgi:hypothetical protein
VLAFAGVTAVTSALALLFVQHRDLTP